MVGLVTPLIMNDILIKMIDVTHSAVCNLASVALPSFVVNGVFDFQKLHDVVKVSAFDTDW